jgi:hypothetical protein
MHLGSGLLKCGVDGSVSFYFTQGLLVSDLNFAQLFLVSFPNLVLLPSLIDFRSREKASSPEN